VAEPPVCAFLNGGPWDGETAVLPPRRMIYEVGLVPSAARAKFGLRPTGYYEARIDASGQLVPHDVEYTEFDWHDA